MNKKFTDKEMGEFWDKFNKRINNPKTKLKDDDLEILKEKMKESLAIDIQKIVVRHAFIGGIVLRFEVVPTRDYRVGTAQTDGTRIFFDIDFYSSLSTEERVFVLAHEVWHNVYLHFLRRQNRESELWNIATDCEINHMLKYEGYNPPPDLCFPDDNCCGKSAEEIYEYLLKKNKNRKPGEPLKGLGGENSGKKNGKKLSGQFDKHSDKSRQNNGDCNDITVDEAVDESMVSDKWGEKGIDPDYTPTISDDVADKIREAVVAEAQKAERLKGSIPGHLQRILKNLLTPEISWQEYLAQFVTSCLGDRRQWLPPQRRHVYNEMYFQSRRGQKIQVTCIVDTSGSTIGDLPKFLTELVSLLNTYGRYELTLIQCDSKVQNVEVYDDSNPFPIDNPEQITFKGFGGSDLRPAFDEIYMRGIEASCNIVFSDGYIDAPQKNPLPCPTLCILTKDGSTDKNFMPWAEKIYFKKNSYSDPYDV